MQPISIQQGNRKAVICGDTVKLLKVSGNKRVTEYPVWPETKVDDAGKIAMDWVYNAKVNLNTRGE